MMATVHTETSVETSPEPSSVASVPGRWVVGVDGSSCGRRAFDWAVLHSRGRASRLQLVTAWEVPIYATAGIDGSIPVPYDGRVLGDAARRDVEELAARTRDTVELPIETAVYEGGAAATLLEAAERADLLVLGSRGRGGFGSLLLGSTSSQCASHARTPTVVVRGEGAPVSTERILVAFDGSPNAVAALDWAIAFAAPGSTIVVVWVWDASPLVVGADEYFFPDASDIATQRFHHLVEEVERKVARDLAADAIGIDRCFLRGRPRDVLVEEAATSDIVVAGARGLGAVGAALLGSVTTSLLHRLEQPLVVVPDRARVPQSASATGAE
jgi:nucleotide-binding universal stress UspA family protein